MLRKIPGLIFGLIFAGAGLFFFSETAFPTLRDWHEMQSWRPAKAQLLSVTGSENQTQATYQYNVNGRTYRGERVYVASFNDNIGSYHPDMRAWLGNRQRAGETVDVWVNPADPMQAVIDRDMRWGLFAFMAGFCSVFIGIGLLVSYASLTAKIKPGRRNRPSLSTLRTEWKQKKQMDSSFSESFLEFAQMRAAELEQQQAGNDAEPADWQARKGWETPSIRSDARKSAIAWWGFAIVWNAISSPMLFALGDEVDKGNYAALLGLLFPLAGALLLYKAIVTTMEFRRFGKVYVEMDPYPGSIGGNVGGRIRISRLDSNTLMDPAVHFSMRLECVYSYVSGTGKNRSRRESVKWAEEGRVRPEAANEGATLGFRFDVPDNLPQADADQTGAYHFWRLSVKAELDGVDLNRQFNIPVFRTGQRSRFVGSDISAQVAKQRVQESEIAKDAIQRGDFDISGLSRAMRISDEGGELRMAFPMFRNKFLTVIAAIFAGGFGFGSYQMLDSALGGGVFGVFIGLFSLPFVLVAFVASIATIYLPLNNMRVHVRMNEISVLRRLLFIPVYSGKMAVADVSHFTIKRSGSTGQGVDKIEHFKLLAHDRRGKSMTIAEDLDGKDVASHFRDYLARRLNVESRP